MPCLLVADLATFIVSSLYPEGKKKVTDVTYSLIVLLSCGFLCSNTATGFRFFNACCCLSHSLVQSGYFLLDHSTAANRIVCLKCLKISPHFLKNNCFQYSFFEVIKSISKIWWVKSQLP